MSGLLELANGCVQLRYIEQTGLRLILACVMSAWGGLCVVMQTQSVVGSLSIKPYLLGKLRQTGWSFLLAGMAQWLLPPSQRWPISPYMLVIAAICGEFPVLIAYIRKIAVEISRSMVYNRNINTKG